jgi:Family of unknown function (DUF6445)
MEPLKYKRFVLVKDNFYDNPDKVYKNAINADFYEPRYYTGYRSKDVYHEPGVKSKLEKILGIKINRWDTNPIEENGVFYQGFSKGKRKEIPGVHSDTPYNDITVVIYLTPGLPFDCGTSLWMHKATKLCDPPTPQDAKRLGVSLTALRNKFEADSKNRSKWLEIDRAGYRYNRMVAYPSGILHSATNHYGGTSKDGRLYQTFRIGVDWNTFKMAKA